MNRQPPVYLLHGLAANRLVMWRLCQHLRRRGWVVRNWGYPSIRQGVEVHAAGLVRVILADEQVERAGCVDIVGHSMGTIVARRAILQLPPGLVRRFVLLTPPNNGSPVATFLSYFLGWFCPALHDLSDRQDSYVNRLAYPTNIEVGVVTARMDWVVPLSSTRWPRDSGPMTVQYTSIGGPHGVLPWRRATLETTERFLARGTFPSASDMPSAPPTRAN
ncbi:MAG: hypothetical protein KDA99_23105 [Planctomycetales bacterium]|nr:hypothetical protein [Planctomycetales bacterium]